MSTAITVGLLSDTHIPYRMRRLPDVLFDALGGVALILHAGDVDDPRALASLREIAPVHAVRGNVHPLDLSDGGASLPPVVELTLAGQRVVLTHGHWSGLSALWLKGWDILSRYLAWDDDDLFNRQIALRLVRRHAEADLIVFGHSHRAYVERIEGVLLVNPGAVCPARGRPSTVARMTLGGHDPRVNFIPLRGHP